MFSIMDFLPTFAVILGTKADTISQAQQANRGWDQFRK
jgi:hypothetical protein